MTIVDEKGPTPERELLRADFNLLWELKMQHPNTFTVFIEGHPKAPELLKVLCYNFYCAGVMKGGIHVES